ncbi:MAG: T9SS type A sorting domain-containing protein [Candidatus Hatepunaea meridiana]|nr:T9SS type A sorting domain-containing protein [Candidatus Hatepunaea meridiana]
MKHPSYLPILICLLALLLVSQAEGTTYVFGEDGLITDLTYYSNIWTSDNTYIIAGDCNVPDDETLTIYDGVEILFDYDYDGDTGSPLWPTITVYGTMNCQGTENSYVWFTNHSGTVKGEFEGLLLDGSGVNEGSLEASYTVFEYGGQTTALLQLDKCSNLDLDNCYIRFSNLDGIATTDISSSIVLESCFIDSNDCKGIDAQHELELFDCQSIIVVNNGDDGIELQSLALIPREYGHYLIGAYIAENRSHGLELGPDAPGILIRNSQFYTNGDPTGIVWGNGIYIDCDGENYFCTIRNCVSAHNDYNGIEIINYDAEALDLDVPIRILNSALWDNSNGCGLLIRTLEECEREDITLFLTNNIFGLNNAYGVGVTDDVLVFNGGINAFKDNNIDSYNDNADFGFTERIIDRNNEPDRFELAYETYDGNKTPPYDFHICWHGPHHDDATLINSGDSDEGCGPDPDGSDTDIGIFGGQYADNFPDNNYTGTRDADYYIRVGYIAGSHTEFRDPVTLWRGIYRVWCQWSTGPNTVFTIEPGTIIEMRYPRIFRFCNVVSAIGTENDHIVFRGFENQEWDGIRIEGNLGSPKTDCQLHYIDVEDVTHSNYVGMYISNLNNGQDREHLELNNVTISGGSGYGLRITNSKVIMTDCRIIGNNGGCRISLVEGHDVKIHGCEFYENDEWGIKCFGSFSNPKIGYVDVGGDFNENRLTRICDNEYGLYCSNNADPILSGDDDDCGYILIRNNTEAQIYLSGGCIPLMLQGNNDIYSEGFQAKALINNSGSSIEAKINYWGTADPDEHEEAIFGGNNNVNYYPWNDDRTTWELDNNEAFWYAMNLYLSNDHNDVEQSIPLLKRIIEDERYGSNRIPCLNYLRDAYTYSGSELEELREYLIDYSSEVNNNILSRIADRQAVWCIVDQGCFREAIDLFGSQRREAQSREDSLWAALDETSVRFISGIDDEEADNIGVGEDYYSLLMDQLSDMLEEEQTRNPKSNSSWAYPVSIYLESPYPNPFNSKLRVSFISPIASNVNLQIFDLKGRLVEELFNGHAIKGKNEFVWNSSGFSSGIYWIHLNGAGNSQTVKVVQVR